MACRQDEVGSTLVVVKLNTYVSFSDLLFDSLYFCLLSSILGALPSEYVMPEGLLLSTFEAQL
jgi:hypothetical protein